MQYPPSFVCIRLPWKLTNQKSLFEAAVDTLLFRATQNEGVCQPNYN